MSARGVYLPGFKSRVAVPQRKEEDKAIGGVQPPAAREPSIYCKCKAESALYHGCPTCVGAGMMCRACWAAHRCEGGTR